MQYQFKQAVHIADKDGRNGKDYARGIHEVSEGHEYSPMFLKYIEMGLIVEPEASVLLAAETPRQRAVKLHNRIIAEQKARALKSVPPVPKHVPIESVPPVKTEATEEVGEVEVPKEEEKPTPEKKHKKK